MQIVSNGDNLHEMSIPVFLEKKKKNIINLSSAELAPRVVKVNLHIISNHVLVGITGCIEICIV